MHMTDATIYDRSFYEQQAARSLQSARIVLGKLFTRVQPKRVVDVGCGVGPWVKAALELGATHALGVDGAYVDQSMLMIPAARFRGADIETEAVTTVLADELAERFDLAISLETAEHLSFRRAESFVAELTALSDLVLFGAAVPFQSGTHHINEQWPEFWAILFRAQGYECWDWLRGEIWADRDVDWWYAQNTLVFAKSGGAAAACLPVAAKVAGRGLGLVHPENFLSNLLGTPRTYRALAAGEELLDFHSLAAAQARQDRVMPALAAVARAEAAGPLARDVFPWTRGELTDPAWQLEQERQKFVALEALARDEIQRREAAEGQLVAFQQQLSQSRTQMAALEARCQTISQALVGTQAQLDAVYGSTLWRAVGPLRRAAGKAPQPLRRLLRRGVKLLWWSVTLQLPARLRARRQAAALPTAGQARAFADFQPSVLAAAQARLLRFLPFDSEHYLALNQEVAASGIGPARHALCYGGLEGRKLFRDEDVARAIGSLAGLPPPPAEKVEFPGMPALRAPIGIYCNRGGNIFMKEIAEDLAADLRASGAQVQLLDETAPMDARPPVCLFIAPHEFFFIGQGSAWRREDIITQSFMLNTEQMQTSWFANALPFLLMARGVIDICSQSAQLLAQAGIEAVNMQNGLLHRPEGVRESDRAHPLFKVLPAAAKLSADPDLGFDERPLDLNFFGAISPYRENFFARHAGRLAEYEAFLYCRRSLTPLSAGGKDGGLTRLAAHVACQSRISLNIHRDEFSYFEWHRIVKLGMYAGSVVVSDPCLPHPGFVPGVHYFEEQPRYIPDLLDWLLKTRDGRDAALAVRAQTAALFREAPPPRETLAPIAQMLWRAQA